MILPNGLLASTPSKVTDKDGTVRKLALLILAAVAAVVILALAGEDEEGENLRRYLEQCGRVR